MLETPDCAVRKLLLRGAVSNLDLLRLAEALERGARLEHLELTFFWAALEEQVDPELALQEGLNFPRLCVAISTSQWLHTIRMKGLGTANFPALLLLVRASRALRHLSVSACRLCAIHFAQLAKVLASPCSRLATLHISLEELGRTGAAALAEMIRSNTSMRELHAGGDDVRYWSDRDIETVLEALRHNTTLRQVTLPRLDAGGQMPQEWSLRELQAATLRTECPRAADVRFNGWSD